MKRLKKWFEKWKSQKGFKKWILPADIALLLLVIAGYFVISAQYKDRFIPGTTINGVDVGSLYADEAQEAVAGTLSGYALNLCFSDGVKEAVKGTDIALKMVENPDIPRLLSEQNRFAWFMNLFGNLYESEIVTEVSFNPELLKSKVLSLPEMQSDVQYSPRDAYLTFNDSGRLEIIPEEEGNEIDTECLLRAARKEILTGGTLLTLTDVDGIYQYPDRYRDDEDLTSCVETVNRFLDTVITVTASDGTEHVIDDSVLRSYLVLGADGLYAVKPEMIEQCADEFVTALAKEDDCYGEFRTFLSTRLGLIHLPAKEVHGHTIDQEAMKALLIEDLTNCTGAKHDLVYSEYADHTDPQFEGTYIEIDIYGQHVYYYKDGVLDFDTPCVTGTEGSSRATPSGIYSVQRKYYDTYLEGPPKEDGTPSYRSHVDYFLAFYRGYGLHDATWRSKSQFGTDRYTYDGSHGCVNLPYDSARYIYKNVEIGTPVVVFRAKMSAEEEAAAKEEAEAAFAKEQAEAEKENGTSGESESSENSSSGDKSEKSEESESSSSEESESSEGSSASGESESSEGSSSSGESESSEESSASEESESSEESRSSGE